VHDELIFEIDESVIDTQEVQIKSIMEEVLHKYAPQVGIDPQISLVVEPHQGATWAEIK
jgi:DNA polymerase I-like protein with 3'-5' exonuclease and polymerase domains